MSIIAAGTTTTTALSSTGNTDGTLQLQVNGTTPSVTLNTLGAIGVGSTPNYGTSGQSLISGGSTAAPTWGTPSSATSATTATTATNLAGGSNGTIPYQSASGTTQMLAAGTTGQVLVSNGAAAPTWGTVSSGATAQYSIVGSTGAQNWTNIAFNPSAIATGDYSVAPANIYYQSSTESRAISIHSPRWSSFYQRWYGVGIYNNSTDYAIYFSKEGLYWYPVVYDIAARSGYVSISYGNTQSNVAIDDSNGRIFLAWVDAGVLTVGYTSITSTTNNNAGTWTNTTISPGGTPVLYSIQYIKMATTGASGIVLACGTSTSSNRAGFIYTCSDGSTTWTQRLSFTAANTIAEFALCYEENGKIFAPTNTTTVAYTTSGDITSGWTTGTTPANAGGGDQCCVGNGYFCFFDGTNIYYSTTGATGSWTLVSTGVSATKLFYTGSVFIALDNPSSSGVQTIRTTATNTPITWSALNGGANINKTFSIMGNFGQRMTAT